MSAPLTPGLERAVAFAALTNRGRVQEWMLWEGWVHYVGCYECAGDGPLAGCWGVEGCHGYENDCSCRECIEIETAELQGEQQARSLLALAGDREDPYAGALRDELALVDARNCEPTDGRAG